MKIFILIVTLATACGLDPQPSCAELGCPFKPSGSPEIWEPCVESACWCGAPALACEVR